MAVFSSPITRDDLVAIAREATAEYFDAGTPLTEAVVKAASLYDKPLTDEHVRRVCEMTYHEAFERHFKIASGMDRYVSFDPPNARAAIDTLHATKAASYTPRRSERYMEGPPLSKMASAIPRKYVPRNAFSEMLKSASDPTPVQWENPFRELKQLRQDLKDAADEVQANLNGMQGAEHVAMVELISLVKQAHNDGNSTPSILHACITSTETDKVASALVTDVAVGLASSGRSAKGDVKEAEVNLDHPIPQTFKKIAELRRGRAHLEVALSDLQEQFNEVNRRILELAAS